MSASPVELIRLLYQRAISSVRDAREHLAARRIAERCSAINKAYLVIVELSTSLRVDEAPQLAAKLGGLYAYMQRRLLEANLKQADEPLAEVLSLLMTLAEAWNAIPDSAASDEAKSAPKNPWANAMAEEPVRIAVSA
jgi:flagellar protein FliS